MFFTVLGLLGALHGIAGEESFLPPNTLHFEDDQKSLSAISEAEFRQVIAEATRPWESLAEIHGARLEVRYLWENEEVNARAGRMGTSWIVEMYGALARRSEVTPDGLTLVVCHELGHLFGGYPFFPSNRLSFEGQADTFATQVCLKELWRGQHAINAERAKELSARELALCATRAQGATERDLCGRIFRAAISVSKLFAALEKGTAPSLLTPSPKVVSVTSPSHPPAQCRLDTYAQGARCGVVSDVRTIPGFESTDKGEQQAAMRRTSCSIGGIQPEHARPACWFKDNQE